VKTQRDFLTGELGVISRNMEKKCDEMKKSIWKNGVNRWRWKHVTLVWMDLTGRSLTS